MIGALFGFVAVAVVSLVVTVHAGPFGLGLLALAGLVSIGGAAA